MPREMQEMWSVPELPRPNYPVPELPLTSGRHVTPAVSVEQAAPQVLRLRPFWSDPLQALQQIPS